MSSQESFQKQIAAFYYLEGHTPIWSTLLESEKLQKMLEQLQSLPVEWGRSLAREWLTGIK